MLRRWLARGAWLRSYVALSSRTIDRGDELQTDLDLGSRMNERVLAQTARSHNALHSFGSGEG
jgi:hypothetical protein